MVCCECSTKTTGSPVAGAVNTVPAGVVDENICWCAISKTSSNSPCRMFYELAAVREVFISLESRKLLRNREGTELTQKTVLPLLAIACVSLVFTTNQIHWKRERTRVCRPIGKTILDLGDMATAMKLYDYPYQVQFPFLVFLQTGRLNSNRKKQETTRLTFSPLVNKHDLF